jgi:hypothetical protein
VKIGASTARTPDRVSLWLLTIGPTIWAAHLLVCYATISIWCSKFTAPGGSLDQAGSAIAWYTGIALAGIAVVGWEGFRRHSYGGAEATTHDLDSPEDRHRFLGFATLLLSGLSAVAVLFAAFAAAHFDTCR